MSLTDRDRKLVLLLAVIVVVAGYWYLVYNPKQEQAGELGDKIATQQSDLNQARQRLTQLTNAQASYASDYTTVVRLGEAVPAGDAIPSLLVQLDALTRNGIDFSQVGVEQYPAGLLGPSRTASEDSGTGAKPPGTPPPAAGESGATPAASQPTQSDDGGAAKPEGQSDSALGVEAVPVRMRFHGDFFRLSKLVGALDRLVHQRGGKLSVSGRLVFIEGFNVKEGRGGFPNVAVSVGALVFALPQDQSLSEGATPQAPSQSGPQPASSDSSPAPADRSTPSATVSPVQR